MDAVGALELANLFKEDPKRKVSRGRIYTDPASFWAYWFSDEGAFYADADSPGDRRGAGVALLMRTDEVQKTNFVKIDADELKDLKNWKSRYEAAQKDLITLIEKHFSKKLK